ncbi:MAG: fatty acid desaturase [Pseudobacteriovorax sp.]|nr:fatty acid desaturase [Pseudobacteriovorax sp.]
MQDKDNKKLRLTSINMFAGEFAWKTILLLGLCYGLWLTAGILVVAFEQPMWLGFLVSTLALYLSFTPMHEASHSNIGGKKSELRWVDDICGHLSAFLLLAPYIAFARLHYRHHQNTNIVGKDPDLWVNGSNPLTIALRCLTIYFKYITHFILDPVYEFTDKVKSVAVLVGIALFVLYLSSLGYGAEVLFLWILPSHVALAFLAFGLDWLPHVPFQETHLLKNTRNLPYPALNWILVYQNYHQIHHLNPRIPFYRYQQAYRHIKPLLDEAKTR